MKLNVAIICGGKSTEHEVSLCSARNIHQALDRSKFDVTLIKIDADGGWHVLDSIEQLEGGPGLPRLQRHAADGSAGSERQRVLAAVSKQEFADRVDVVFPIIHGAFGEDGCLQGFLRMLDIPFVGADVLGSAIGMDKDVMKRLLQQAGIATPRFVAITRSKRQQADYATMASLLGDVLFVKPANAGSSVGVSKARTEEEYKTAVDEAFKYDNKIMVEEAIVGREFECSVMGNDDPVASTVGEVAPNTDFYSYEAKYIDEGGAIVEIPANVSEEIIQQVRKIAVDAYTALCCSGMARVDFFHTADGRLLVNEINTLPGFTNISMYPQLWEASGVSYTDLITKLIDFAMERHQRGKNLDYAVAGDKIAKELHSSAAGADTDKIAGQ
jgi:D-alanine-D-alanine ligase